MTERRRQELQAFLDALKEDPYDAATHKVFADWLDENDSPERADQERTWTPEWQQAYDRVDDFCRRVNLNREYLLDRAGRFLRGEDVTIDVSMDTSNEMADEEEANIHVRDRLWDDLATVLRMNVRPTEVNDPFNCNCVSGEYWEYENDGDYIDDE